MPQCISRRTPPRASLISLSLSIGFSPLVGSSSASSSSSSSSFIVAVPFQFPPRRPPPPSPLGRDINIMSGPAPPTTAAAPRRSSRFESSRCPRPLPSGTTRARSGGTASRRSSSREAPGDRPGEGRSAAARKRTKELGGLATTTTRRRLESSASMANAESTTTTTTTTTTTKKTTKRTKSFQPAWWGNVLPMQRPPGGAKFALHPHAVPSGGGRNRDAISDDRSSSHCPPIHTLILGTHPSVSSLERGEMYGHPQNAFWYIAGDCLGFRRSEAISPVTGRPYATFCDHLRYDEVLDYPRQLERVVSRGFALWDIVAECERAGSLDADIRGEVVNPIREFCEGTLRDDDSSFGSEHVSIRRIVIANGTTGAKMFVKHFASWFEDGKLRAGSNDMSKRAFGGVMKKAKKASNISSEDGGRDRRSIEVVCLPGVSPAAAKFTYLEKRDEWERGCYLPGLKDYEDWNNSKRRSADLCKTPEKIKSESIPPESESSTKRKTPSKLPPLRLLSSDLATLAPENEWIDLEVPAQELRPSATLTTGQCFNWLVVEGSVVSGTADNVVSSPQKSAWGIHDAKEWVGVALKDRVISIRETPKTTLFRVLRGPEDGAKDELRSYFRLETPLAPLYGEWSKQDARLARIAEAIPGVRIVRQDPHECLFSFICSSNNNIPRITKMLSSFREKYGKFLMELPTRQDTGEVGTLSLFSFPTLSSLADATESDLRTMGLGYRAKYIIETRDLLKECGGDDYLLKLRTQRDAEAVQEELIKFSGIGRKVADCIALFSLDQNDAIPVDVHVQHIASRDYDPTVLGEAKSITPTIYRRVGDLFRDRFTNYPGWAHSLLFVAELPSFRDVLPVDVVSEMDHWRKEEQRKMQAMKEERKNKQLSDFRVKGN